MASSKKEVTRYTAKAWGILTRVEYELLMKSLVTCLSEEVPGAIVELGVHKARTSRAISKRIPPEDKRKFVGVECRPKFRREFNRRAGNLRKENELLFGTTAEMADEFHELCAWIFVDACHCYSCVMSDIDKWGSKLVVGGYLVFHDTQRTMEPEEDRAALPPGTSRHRKDNYGVPRALKENEFFVKNFRLLWAHDAENGLRVYKRVS